MNIEIITTSNGATNETGFGNLSSCQSILDSIKRMSHKCLIYSCESLVDLESVLKRKPDLVVLSVKFILMENGQNIWLSEFFEDHAIPHTGSSKNVIMFDSDKVLAKRHLQKKGIPTALFFTAQENEFRRDDDLPLKYPLFLKPISAANSNGVDEDSYVSSFPDFERKVSAIKNTFNQPALVEEYLDGAEYTVAMLTTKSGEFLVSAVEVLPPESFEGRRILCKDTKNENTEVLRKITDQKLHYELRKIAFEVFIGIGAEGFARVDIRSNESGNCFFMEVNLVPGMTLGSSYFPEAFRVDGELSYDQVVSHIIDYCLFKEIKAMQCTEVFHIE